MTYLSPLHHPRAPPPGSPHHATPADDAPGSRCWCHFRTRHHTPVAVLLASVLGAHVKTPSVAVRHSLRVSVMHNCMGSEILRTCSWLPDDTIDVWARRKAAAAPPPKTLFHTWTPLICFLKHLLIIKNIYNNSGREGGNYNWSPLLVSTFNITPQEFSVLALLPTFL